MSNIVIAFSKPEVAAGIKKILTQSGYSVQAVCTTGAQALASVNNLECGILICGCRFMDMMYMEIHDYLPPEFQMLLIASPSSIQEREVSNLVCLSMPMKVHELLQTIEMMEGDIQRRRRRCGGSRNTVRRRISRSFARQRNSLWHETLLRKRKHINIFRKEVWTTEPVWSRWHR